MFRMIIAVALVVLFCSAPVANAQSHDLTYFANKWSRQQQDIAENCVVSWFAGSTLTEVSNHIVELVRVEALLASTHTAEVRLILPSVGEVSPQEVPGRILTSMLNERGLSIAPASFFENQQFQMILYDTDASQAMHDVMETDEHENLGMEEGDDEE